MIAMTKVHYQFDRFSQTESERIKLSRYQTAANDNVYTPHMVRKQVMKERQPPRLSLMRRWLICSLLTVASHLRQLSAGLVLKRKYRPQAVRPLLLLAGRANRYATALLKVQTHQ